MLVNLLSVALVIGAAPADREVAQVTRLAAPGLTSVQLDEKVTSFYTEHLAHQMGHAGVQVYTPQEISTVIGFERQRQLMGCTDEECVAELASAMGIDGLVTGSIGKFGQSVQVNLKVISARDASTLASFTGRVKGDEDTLDLLSQAGHSLATDVLKALGRKPVQVRAQVGTVKRWPLWPTVAGGVLAAAGGGALLWANASHQRLRDDAQLEAPTMSPREASGLADTGRLAQTAGWVLVGAGAAALASSVVFYTVSSPKPVQASVGVGPGAVSLTFQGEF
jgi:hypothetical protein